MTGKQARLWRTSVTMATVPGLSSTRPGLRPRLRAGSPAERLIAAALEAGLGPTIEQEHRVRWNAGLQLLQSDDPGVHDVGVALAVQALIRTPEVVSTLPHEVYDALAAGVPTLDDPI